MPNEDHNQNDLNNELDEFQDEINENSEQYDAIEDIEISKEMRDSFLDYSMSVIVQRALPDVRDGMKPVHRRILYAMSRLNMTPGSAHKKSARIVGDVIGKYHPHGDTAVYEAMVRMAQDFSYRYPLVDGHGNFGSLDGDGAAAMRYTEARMSKISMEMVADLNKETVDFIENYDGDDVEPVVLPSRIPNLLVNGAMGIAVGMATNIPTHNLSETVKAIKAVMDDPDVSVPELMEYLPGPDFPTGGIIIGRKGIRDAYETGKGSIMLRAKYRVEDMGNGKKRIIYYEIPYGVNKMKMYEKMAEVVRDKLVQGVVYLNDESNREGVRIVMELKKDVQEEVIINQMFRLTPLQTTFGINMLALENGRPKQLSLKNIIVDYILHQEDVIIRRTKYELRKAQERLHIVKGLLIALDNLDELITMIRQSHDEEPILIGHMNERFGLDEIQSKAILAMQIRRLSGLEREKIENEFESLNAAIADYQDILANKERVLGIIRENLDDIAEKYGDARKTDIIEGSYDVLDEDLIPEENIILTLTDSGYIKAQQLDTYHTQNRGGKGIRSISLNEEDSIDRMITLSNHDFVLLFTNLGRVYRLKGYQFPLGSRTSKGMPIVNLLPLQENEKVTELHAYNDSSKAESLLFITSQGIVKRTPIQEFYNINRNGKIAITLNEGDQLAFVKSTLGDEEIVIAGDNGKAIRFKETEVRQMSRTASGVRGFDTAGGHVVGAATSSEGNMIFALSENGYGKQSLLDSYRLTSRGKKGVRTLNVTGKTGALVALKAVTGDEDALIATQNGQIIRVHLHNISVLGRNTQGVRVVKPNENDKVYRVTLVDHEEQDSAGDLPENLKEELPVLEGELVPEIEETTEIPEVEKEKDPA
ncbi:DNA gyrase subunit A [Ileibacterium valens]|uniref:DNA gyrase subunit A n=1 Tax=Ileibacterium valens TaxID=1862668 RepID=A0A1U7NFE6_9FIRM|nr:DNA gyrase subunit A [Ileibacterium valens]OLU37855.1 DNA gyrase subunit A [Erysipelotrichaceae bacterium NYU-BL-E8]OLU38965.1 DNA gyrase subunit A [Ileibacterium valens]OLU40081.1 DNA gyrase subunit A [Erysipelotrichaceae bacterium NYU-BL-F16]